MLNFLRSTPKPPSADELEKLKYWMSQFQVRFKVATKSFDSALDSLQPDLFSSTVAEDLSKLDTEARKAKIDANSAMECLRNAQNEWPNGRRVLDDLVTAMSYFQKMIGNLLDFTHLWQAQVSYETKLAKQKSFFLNNREYGKEADKYFNKGMEQLLAITGIRISLE